MKRISIHKKSIFILSALLSICAAPTRLMAMTVEDLTFVEQITISIKSLVQETESTIQSFIDTKNTKPLRAYITEFHDKIKFVNAAILVPLKDKLNDPMLDHNSAMHHILKAAEELLADLNKELVAFQKIFIHPENLKTALKLATVLGQHVDKLATKYIHYEQKLIELNTHLKKHDLHSLVQEIEAVITLIRKAKAKPKPTDAEKAAIVLMLRKKMK